LEAIAAIYCFTSGWLERNLRFDTAAAASSREHFALLTETAVGTAAVHLSFTSCTAARATGRLILEAFFCVESLLGSSEIKVSAAFFAGKIFVLVIH
jgi:hypothetical protein